MRTRVRIWARKPVNMIVYRGKNQSKIEVSLKFAIFHEKYVQN